MITTTSTSNICTRYTTLRTSFRRTPTTNIPNKRGSTTFWAFQIFVWFPPPLSDKIQFESIWTSFFSLLLNKGAEWQKKKENRTTTKSISELIRKLIKRKKTGRPSLLGNFFFTTCFTCTDSMSLRRFEEKKERKQDLNALSFLFCSVPFVAHSKETHTPLSTLSCARSYIDGQLWWPFKRVRLYTTYYLYGIELYRCIYGLK